MGFFRRLKERVTKPRATVAISLNKNAFTLGEDLEGTLLVTSEEEFDATEVRAEFRCLEKEKKGKYEWNEQTKRNEWKEYWETATLHSADVKASGEFHLTSGCKKEFLFSTNIPAGGKATKVWTPASPGP